MTKLLDAAALYRACDVSLLEFETTAELAEAEPGFGQARAVDAVRFAVDMPKAGFNLFVLGQPGSGRHALVAQLVQEKAASLPPASDWCYVHNMDDPMRPRALPLPPGRGVELRKDMQRFVDDLGPAITAAFEGDEYRSRAEGLQNEYKEKEDQSLRALGHESVQSGIALLRTPQGFIFAPMKGEEAMSPEEFNQLPAAERVRMEGFIESYGERLSKLLHQFPRWRRELQGKLRDLSRETMSLAVGHLIEDLKEHYTDLLNVLGFLDQVLADVVEQGEALHESREGDEESSGISVQRYQVNLVVDNLANPAAPVVFEDNPTFPSLVGRVDQLAHMGTLLTNFTLVRSGAFHRANGGFLMLEAAKVLTQPYAWEGLKRVLKAGQIRIESLGQVYGFGAGLSLEPEPIPLSCKVVLFGEPMLYYLLKEYDPEFDELFKVAADFDEATLRDDGASRSFAGYLGNLAREGKLRPFHRAAVARLIEHAARLAGDGELLSLGRQPVLDIMTEADYLAGKAARENVAREDVEAALAQRIHRTDRIRDIYQREILRGTLIIASSGFLVGQINGLAVIQVGDFAFAHPVRISATVRLGEGDVMDIERETELGGAIHSKGVMILYSFLAARYARETPLPLAASLVFEQSYGPVEGDSASLAELCVLLSALSGLPINQSLAVTGSVNQHGRVQAIGGVNEKIEGFYDICAARGLTGEQGVLIPEDNVKHLMLREDVVTAVRDGKFRIWSIADVDGAIELLTGVAAGEPDDQGNVPPETVNYLVAAQLGAMLLARQDFSGGGEKKKGKKPPAAE
ncbi:MAG: AAA family ATPase [Rhodocyclaceae bacterium]|nr:AAA family ATPase [Rhodocyclaceae bacterium]